jgi:WD40 repeat protein
VWDAQTGQDLRTLKEHTDWVNSVCLSGDGKRLVSGSGDRTIKVWDAQTGLLQLTLRGHTDPVWSVCLSVDGKHIVSGSADHTIKVWDAMPPAQAP